MTRDQDKSSREPVSISVLEQSLNPEISVSHRMFHRDYREGPNDKVKSLYGNIIPPSYVHGYSLGIDYMNTWFQNGFDKDFFKSVYIDGKHVLDDYKKFSKMVVKGENPRARIEPRVEFDFDREGLDMYMAPPEVYLRRSRWQDAFFKDYDRNLFLGVQARGMRMNFNFKVRVNSRSQQIDLYNKMEINFRVGATMGENISVDFHVPKSVILYIAEKAGFKVVNNEVVDIIEFMQYLNSHSEVPFLFKLRAINQKPEFFIRVDVYAHVSNRDKLNMDDGERDGKLDFNFHIEMNSILDLPVPWYYAFYSAEDYTSFIDVNEYKDFTNPIYSINLIDIPKVDENGWNQACITDYLCDDGESNIDLSELFSGENVVSKAINHDLTLNVSPNHFINVKIYRDIDQSREVEFTMNWETLQAELKHPEPENVLHIAIYVDRDYINELQINMQSLYAENNRISASENNKSVQSYIKK